MEVVSELEYGQVVGLKCAVCGEEVLRVKIGGGRIYCVQCGAKYYDFADLRRVTIAVESKLVTEDELVDIMCKPAGKKEVKYEQAER